MAEQVIRVHPPLAGVVKRYGFQLQPPFSCFKSINFWPVDARTDRQVSATRPPLAPFPSPGSPVNMLCRINDPRPSLLAACDGVLYRWSGGWSSIASDVEITTTRPVYATPFLLDAIIASGGAPLIYRSDGNTLSRLVATAGTMPSDARVCCSWQGGVWLAGDPSEPHIFFGSRTGDATDWDYFAADAGGAFAAVGENAGMIGEPITALVPHTTDTLVIGSHDSMWCLRGHPRRGGVLEALSQQVGILGQGAWCKTPGDQLFFMSKAGLVVLLPQAGAIPTPISRERIPSDLLGLAFDSNNPTISMAYDARWNGIHICVRGSNPQAWWYDLDNGGFFQMEFSDYPYVMDRFGILESSTTSGVLYGGPGYGGLARFDVQGREAVTRAEQYIGPIRLSNSSDHATRIENARVMLGEDMYAGSGGVTIYTDSTAELVASNAELDSPARKHHTDRDAVIRNAGRVRPKLVGHAGVIKLDGGTNLDNPFVFEAADLGLTPAGRNAIPRVRVLEEKPVPTAGYATANAPGAGFAIPGFTLMLDMSLLPESWWELPRADGGDIRVRLPNNTICPADLIEYDKMGKRGLLAFKVTLATSPTTIRIWAGDETATTPSPNDPIGQYNAYDEMWLGFWPFGGGEDRTINQRHLTMSGNPVVGGVEGPIGNSGTHYDGAGTQYGQSIGTLSLVGPYSMTGFFLAEDASNDPTLMGVCWTDNGTVNRLQNSSRLRITGTQRLRIDDFADVGDLAAATSLNTWPYGQYRHFISRQYENASRRLVVLDGNTGAAHNVAGVVGLTAMDSLVVGARSVLVPNAEFFKGKLSLLGLHSGHRVFDWVTYTRAMQDQFTFWGGSWQYVEAPLPA